MTTPSIEEAFKQIAALRTELATANRTIQRMQAVGGFADSKMLGTRSQRLEDRVQVLEFDSVMLKDVVAHFTDFVGKHLEERHGLNLDRDNAPEIIFFRKIKRRLREWADSNGEMRKRNELRETRQDENRLRPASSQL